MAESTTLVVENARISGKSSGYNPYISVSLFVRDGLHMASIIIVGKFASGQGGMDGLGNFAVYKYNPVEGLDKEGNSATVDFPFIYKSRKFKCVMFVNPTSASFVVFDENGVPVVDLGEPIPGTFTIS